eukprot:CAMPEP_0173430538 /NCGR_PEP_ID=MMETSP1357-20121228/8932_1 /TAXON_ID=77926 /ORGANISM="Hemiselmis rufescens, Strain PCC563" /LENGTH=201 /DNA_ID=CAMNT_0014394893 /DNA_START=299 /DNA_END=904 /DNA_ORIENTATION=+
MSKITLTYFNAPGRAEAIRVALFTAGVAFEDKRFGGVEEFMKAKPTIPGGSVPIIEIDGKVYTQSAAIARWAGKKSNLYPKDELAALRVDEVIDICADISAKTPTSKDEAEKKKLREEFAAGFMKVKMDLLESYCGGGTIAGGSDITLGDLTVASMVDSVKTGNFDHIPGTYMDSYPKMCALADKVEKSDIMTKYKASQAK